MAAIRQRRTAERVTPLDEGTRDLLRPMLSTGRAFYIFAIALLILIGWFGYVWYIQLTQGLGVTAMRTPVGATWGGYIANFVFFVGIAHGGIAIAAAIRLLKLKGYTPIARMGEVLTVISLGMAGLSIMIDMGRPDRVFNMILYWPERVGASPLSWDVTVIILYFTLSISYLWLTMRRDLARYLSRFPQFAFIYRFLLVGYNPDEKEGIDRMTWWLSVAIVFLIVMLSGGVVPWIFGLLSGRPGWFSAIAGPYFLTAAIASAIAAVIAVAFLLRKIFRWEEYIKNEIFKGLGTFLGILTLFYTYFIFAEQLTMRFAPPVSEFRISEMLLQGEFAPIFWPMAIFGFFIPAHILIIQGLHPKWFSVARTFWAAVLIVVAFWVKRFLIVVPSLLRSLLPFPQGSYTPNWIEWSIIAGIFALAVLFFILFLKVFPIVEPNEE